MRIVQLILLHFGIAAVMSAGFALLPLVCSAAVRLRSRRRRAEGSAPAAARRREHLRLLAALRERGPSKSA